MRPLLACSLLFALGLPLPAQAQVAAVAVADSGDTAWLILCALLLLMAGLPGLLLRQAGLSHVRGALAIGVQGLAVAAVVSLVWAVAGYTLAFAPANDWTAGWIGGGINLMLANLGALRDGLTVPESAFVLFQMALAIFAACLLPGAVAGRVKPGWMLAFVPFWLLFVYAPVVHWIWGGGWLAAMGVIDFAGGIAVHLCAGFSALTLALIVGRRRVRPERSHAPLLAMAGGAMLWVGWAGIVGGWALGATDDAATAILNSHLAACAGALGWMLTEKIATGRPGASGAISGALAGLVTISASAALVGPGGAMVIGLVGAIACRAGKALLAERIDDAADIFLIHGLGGAIGALLLVPFVLPALGGVGFEPGVAIGGALLAQLIGVAVVALWAMVGSAIVALILSVLAPPRLSAQEEADGLDLTLHGQQAWDFR